MRKNEGEGRRPGLRWLEWLNQWLGKKARVVADRFGGWLNRGGSRRVQRLTVGLLLIMLGMFVQVVYEAIHDPRGGMRFQSITVPVRANVERRKDSARESRLRHYWDSVYHDAAMKKSLDSLSLIRAGFADTMRQLWENVMKEKN